MQRILLSLALVATATASADEKMVGTPGSKVEYPATIKESVGDKPVEMRLTGTALRTKAIFSVWPKACNSCAKPCRCCRRTRTCC